MKILALAAVVVLPVIFAFTSLLSEQSREVAEFRQSATEDALVRRLMLEQLERDRGHAEQQIAEGRAANAAESQFLARYNDFADQVTVMMRGVVDHKTDLKASGRVDKAWRKWRSDPAWPGPKQER